MKSIHKVNAGHYWSDGGAFMGVMPWAIWSKHIQVDKLRRQRMNLNLLLIMIPGRNILVDTGLGNRLSPKQIEIYQPSEFMLPFALSELGLNDIDLTDVVMTHLHFDHAGGIATSFGNTDALTFPKATHWIQKSEWEMAKNPDGLNHAAYNFKHQLSLLESSGTIELIDGECEIAPGITLIGVGGHSVGSQIVQVDLPEGFYIYAGDIVPTYFHTSPAITSAYDIARKDTYAAKKLIYSRLKERDGILLLDHDLSRWEIPASELRI
ncbi:MAG: MBL fold metallo-hydrolase [Candidatus Cloacimonetes bacterium]|nr:MBL fold metallo-hydrolase [Candidatus Cloacimonadota bacterium]